VHSAELHKCTQLREWFPTNMHTPPLSKLICSMHIVNMQACAEDLVPADDEWFMAEPADQGPQSVRAATNRVSTRNTKLTPLA
jgi:hypothetical protein